MEGHVVPGVISCTHPGISLPGPCVGFVELMSLGFAFPFLGPFSPICHCRGTRCFGLCVCVCMYV